MSEKEHEEKTNQIIEEIEKGKNTIVYSYDGSLILGHIDHIESDYIVVADRLLYGDSIMISLDVVQLIEEKYNYELFVDKDEVISSFPALFI